MSTETNDFNDGAEILRISNLRIISLMLSFQSFEYIEGHEWKVFLFTVIYFASMF